MSSNPFDPNNFDPSQMPSNRVVVFDDTGYLDNGGYANPALNGYTQAIIDAYIEAIFAGNGLAGVVFDIDAQFADATYFNAINFVSSGSQSTTLFIDHGFQGTAGSDVIVDSSGDTIANTGKGADLLLLGQGLHFVDTGAGNDVVVSGNENDVFKLGSGDDWLWANGGDDNVRAGSGNDTVLGLDGADKIKGGKGDDDLQGGSGADTVNGGQDNDRIEGGADNDKLTGGTGEDVFVYGGGTGRDVIRDFEDGLDRIEIDVVGTGLTAFADLLLSQQGNNVRVDLSGRDQIIMKNVGIADLSAADFDFV